MNPWRKLISLLPGEPLIVVEVLSHTGTGASIVELPTGEIITVQGDSVGTGLMAYVRRGRVESEAPAITPVEVEV